MSSAIIPRKFRQIFPNSKDYEIFPKPISDFLGHSALVVLGDPGSGKTTSFRCAAQSEPEAEYTTVRDFLVLPIERWKGKTLYLDGLDEQRAKNNDGTLSLDLLRSKLADLGYPRFRLSCRSADWYGSSDLESLKQVAPDHSITVLSLEPLSNADICAITQDRVPDSAKFLEEAAKRGIDELLRNPQTLDLILTVVESNDWPTTRTELYKKACELLIREKNAEHARVHQDKANISELIEASGFISAVVLCGGLQGIALSEENASENFPYIEDLCLESEKLRLAAYRRLFKENGAEQREPIHRTIGEYLAARYLAGRVRKDLPIGRLLAILTGSDGGTLSDLRGVYAWLACLCPEYAETLIPIDPVGAIIYGDVAPLAPSTKKLILSNLQQLATQHPWFRHESRDAYPFGGLACDELTKDFCNVLLDPNESTTVKSCVLDAIGHGTPLPQLADDLLFFARDNSQNLFLRRDAIQAFRHICPQKVQELVTILDEICASIVHDNDLFLRGNLLTILYPQVITHQNILKYVVADTSRTYGGGYSYFLGHVLAERTGDADIPSLLDAVACMEKHSHHDYSWGQFIGGLLTKALKLHGESADIQRLHNWLSSNLDKHRSSHAREKDKRSIREWLEQHPQRMLELLEYWIEKTPVKELHSKEYFFYKLILGDINSLWMQKALIDKASSEANADRSEYYFSKAVQMIYYDSCNSGLTIDDLYTFTKKHPQFLNVLKDNTTSKLQDWRIEQARNEKKRRAEKEKELNKRRKILLSMIDLIKEGAQHNNLRVLANFHNGHYYGADEKLLPYDRLVHETTPEIAKAAIEGFHSVLYRIDLPTPEEIAISRLGKKSFYVGLPVLIGLNLYADKSTGQVLQLPESTLKSAVAFHYIERDDKDSAWLPSLCLQRPDLVSDALNLFWGPQLTRKCEHIDGLHEFEHKNDMHHVRERLAISLLAKYPNCSLASLGHLLWSAHLSINREDFLVLIRDTIRHPARVKGMQRLLWYGSAFLIAPEEFTESLRRFIANDQDKAFAFLSHVAPSWSYHIDKVSPLSAFSISSIIEIVGSLFSPFDEFQKTDSRVTNAEDAARTIRKLIDTLSAISNFEATSALDALIGKSALWPWRDSLLHACAVQRKNLRDASFRYPTLHQVIETFRDGKPANISDLKAIVFDRLKTLRNEFRNDPLNSYKQFWNIDYHGKATEAIPENDCRDRLLGRLRPTLLGQGIQAEPEGYFAEGKRADIKVLFSTMVLPIEIKRHYHDELWTAPLDQLKNRYSRDPGAEGHGIYLVFWFGIDFRAVTKPPTTITSALTSAADLETALSDTIPPDYKSQIEIIVLDCSRPPKGHKSV